MFHGRFLVSHQCELDPGKLSQAVDEPVYISVIQRCFHLIQDAERRRFCLQYRKHQRDSRQRLFTTGKQIDVLQFFTRRLCYDIYIGAERILFVRKSQLGMSASEQFLKFLFEIDDDLIEAFLELDPDRLVHIVDDPVKIVSRFLDVRPLPGKEFIPFTHRLIFFDGAHVDLSQFPHPVLHLTAFLHGRRHNELLRTEFHGLYV